MKSLLLIAIHVACAFVLFSGACTNNHANTKLIGKWRPKMAGNVLIVTDKQFTMDSPEPEDYFVKGDTIYTSFEGNLPYSKYVIKKLGDHELTLLTPDSATVEYAR